MRWRHCLGVILSGKGTKTKGIVRSLRIINLPSSCFRLHIMIRRNADRAVTLLRIFVTPKAKMGRNTILAIDRGRSN